MLTNKSYKRPVFLVSCVLLFLCSLWGAVAKSFNSLLASNIVGGLAGGSTEALGAAIVNVGFLAAISFE